MPQLNPAQASTIVQPPPQTTSPAQAQGQTGQRQPSVPAPLAPPANVLRHPPPPLTSPNTTNIHKAAGTRAPAQHNLHHLTTQNQNLFHPTDTRSEHKHQVMAAPQPLNTKDPVTQHLNIKIYPLSTPPHRQVSHQHSQSQGSQGLAQEQE